MAEQNSATPFVVRFVAAERGVKSEARVEGRIAFPSNRGPQPKAGEFWRVTIQGENPKKTVYFLTCVEQVEQPADYQSPKVESKPKPKQPHGDRKSKGGGDRFKFKGEPGKGRDSMVKAMQGMWSFGAPTDAKLEPSDYVFAPGADAYEQAKAWLTPAEKIDMTNLRFAHAQKLGAFDPAAREIAIAMALSMRCVDQARGEATALTDALKGICENDRTVAQECYTAAKRLTAATEAKRQLQLDTLSYGRLVQSYKKQGKADDAEANAHLAVIKGDLDQRRTVVNSEFEAATEASKDAETSRHFAYCTEEVDRARGMLTDMEIFKNAVPTHMEELKSAVKRYEERIDQLRKSA